MAMLRVAAKDNISGFGYINSNDNTAGGFDPDKALAGTGANLTVINSIVVYNAWRGAISGCTQGAVTYPIPALPLGAVVTDVKHVLGAGSTGVDTGSGMDFFEAFTYTGGLIGRPDWVDPRTLTTSLCSFVSSGATDISFTAAGIARIQEISDAGGGDLPMLAHVKEAVLGITAGTFDYQWLIVAANNEIEIIYTLPGGMAGAVF